MTTKLTEQDKSITDGDQNGNVIAITTWEEACAKSQTWANQARRKAYYRRVRHRAIGIVLFALLLVAIAVAIVWVTTT